MTNRIKPSPTLSSAQYQFQDIKRTEICSVYRISSLCALLHLGLDSCSCWSGSCFEDQEADQWLSFNLMGDEKNRTVIAKSVKEEKITVLPPVDMTANHRLSAQQHNSKPNLHPFSQRPPTSFPDHYSYTPSDLHSGRTYQRNNSRSPQVPLRTDPYRTYNLLKSPWSE